MNHLITGVQAEILAKQFLESQGLRTVATNFYSRYGEIDIIMYDQSQLVFIEVRFRQQNHYGNAANSIDHQKQQRIVRSANVFLLSHDEPYSSCRFDVVAMGPTLATHHIEWLQSAFTCHSL
jgi:putative endonuclease